MPNLKAAVARGLMLAYGERVALEASDFVIPAGSATALIGPNGSGKSTLLDAMAGLKQPASGHLEVLGSDPRRSRRHVAYVLQATKVNEVMPITVREAVMMGRYSHLGLVGRSTPRDRRAVDEVLERLDITAIQKLHLRELSGGQRQRVFVAQGLVQERRLLLLDEPLTGLDLISRDRILAVIEEERRAGRTVVFTTHDLAEAHQADHVLLLAGRVIAGGPPAEVLTAAHLSDAYGFHVVDVEDGALVIDDPAHLPTERRHVHLDRSEHIRRRP